ncbi:prolyl oligopeptidase family serine peptidase [Streptosporangium soli]|nr:prolyl oligopeptidase family serine peptidase [Streptosporangium sp. KLBMP 9127]
MRYPESKRSPITEEIHGHQVSDPYRWLEDPSASREWLAAQDELWHAQAGGLSSRERFRARLTELGAIGTVTPPVWSGERCFVLRRAPGEEHPVLYCDDEVLLDPMRIDPGGLTTLDDWQPDPTGELIAYQLSRGGDEKASLYVMDVRTGKIVDGPIGGCRYSPVAWPAADAFYYVRFQQGIFLHRLGTPPETDVTVFTAGQGLSYGLAISADRRWLTISAAQGASAPNDLWLADLSTGGCPPEMRVIQRGVAARTAAAVGRDGRLYVLTDRDAPRRRLCVADPASPQEWAELIPEDPEAVLGAFTIVDGPDGERPRLLAVRIRHAVGEIGVHDPLTGAALGQVELPGSGTVGGLTGRPDGGPEAWFTYTDAVTPAGVWRYDARDGTATLWAAPPGDVPVLDVESRQVTYSSADGTQVRMIVVAVPSRNGPRPTILTGYGGFGIPLLPGYAADSLAWVEAGGVLAVAQLRGGGEEGESWHRDGMRECKQNVFDDFAAAAERLVADRWTTPDRLGIWGESNGGLLVGAALTQRPELFGAAVCAAPLLDMARYERSGLGPSWRGEYGSAADPEEFAWLLSYSPYHRVQPGVDYPATLFTVSGEDSRVDPMHARKMCAALQQATAGERPILLRNEPDTGHGARAVSRSIALAADALAFLAARTGLSDPA